MHTRRHAKRLDHPPLTNRRLVLALILTPLASATPRHVVAQAADLIVTKAADFVILDQDIMRVPPELILGTNVLATYLGGRAVFQKPVP